MRPAPQEQARPALVLILLSDLDRWKASRKPPDNVTLFGKIGAAVVGLEQRIGEWLADYSFQRGVVRAETEGRPGQMGSRLAVPAEKNQVGKGDHNCEEQGN
jgi:hypothetical protein